MSEKIATVKQDASEPVQRDLGKIVLRNSVVITIGEWITKVLNFGFTIYAIRLLGETDWGRYATVVAFVNLFGIFFELGMTQYVQRTIAQDRSRAQTLFWNMVALRLILAVPGIVVITSLAVLFGYEPALVVGMFLFACTFLLAALLVPLGTVLTANERFDFSTVLQLCGQLLNIALSILFLQMGFGFMGLIYTGFIAMPTLIVLNYWIIRHLRLGNLPFHFAPATWPAFVRASLPFGLSSIAQTYSVNADTVILGFFHNSSSVGWYNAAYRLVFNLTSIASGFYRSITPSLARENMSNPERVRNWTRVGIQGLAFIALPIAVGVSLLGAPIVEWLYGAAYLPAGIVLSLIIWDVPLMMFNAFCGNITTAVGLERPAARIYLISSVSGVLLYVLLIPPYGMLAAAAVTVFIDLFNATQFFILLHRQMEVGQVTNKLGLNALAAGLMGVGVWLMRDWNLFLVIGLSGVAYLGLAQAFGLLNWPLILSSVRRVVRK